jgi:hypothetical protein
MARDIGGKRALRRKTRMQEDTMATKSRSRSASRAVSKKNITKKPIAGAKETKPTFTAEQLRKAFPDARFEQRVEIKDTDLHGMIGEVVARLGHIAKDNGLNPSEFEIGKRTKRETHGKSYSRYSTSVTKLYLIGYRPYTDEELLAEGANFLKKENARIDREYKKKLKEVREFNTVAKRVGQPTIAEPVKPKPVTL